MTHKELVDRGVRWLKNNQINGCRHPIVLPEYKCYANSIPDVIGMNHQQTTVLECKVSRADYLQDINKGHRHYTHQLGNYRYYLCPAGMLSPDEINDGWGLLYCHPHKITIEKDAYHHPLNETRIEEYQVMYSIIRRLMSLDGHDNTLELLRSNGR